MVSSQTLQSEKTFIKERISTSLMEKQSWSLVGTEWFLSWKLYVDFDGVNGELTELVCFNKN